MALFNMPIFGRGFLFKSHLAEYPAIATSTLPKFVPMLCNHCHKDERLVPFKRCSACHFIYYCDRACQLAAWNKHKVECPFLTNKFGKWSKIDDANVSGYSFLIFRLLLKRDSGELQAERAKYPNPRAYPKEDGPLYARGIDDAQLQLIKAAAEHLYGKPVDAAVFFELWGELKKVKATETQFFKRIGNADDTPSRVGTGFALTLGSAALQHACRPNVHTYFDIENVLCVLPLPTLEWKPSVDAKHNPAAVRIARADEMTTKGVRRFEVQHSGVMNHPCDCARCVDPADDLLSAIRCNCGESIPIDDTSFRRSATARFRHLSMPTRKRLARIIPMLPSLLTAKPEEEWEYFSDEYKSLVLICSKCHTKQPTESIEFGLAMMSAIALLSEAGWRPLISNTMKAVDAFCAFDRECSKVLPDCNLYTAFWNEMFSRIPLPSVDQCARLRKCWAIVERCIPFGHVRRFDYAIPLCHALLASGCFDEATVLFDELRRSSEIYYGFGKSIPFFDRLLYFDECIRERRVAEDLVMYEHGAMGPMTYSTGRSHRLGLD